MKNKAVIEAQREVIQGYYNWIGINHPTEDELMNKLEADLNYIRQEEIVLEAENIIADKHEISKVQCDVCNYNWIAVRPEGLIKLECPKCGNLSGFENINH